MVISILWFRRDLNRGNGIDISVLELACIEVEEREVVRWLGLLKIVGVRNTI